MSVTVYGASDDLIEVEGDISEEYNAWQADGKVLAFSDGTVLRISYTREGIWRIVPLARGEGLLEITQAVSADDERYSDRATIDGARISWCVYGQQFTAAPSANREPPRLDPTNAADPFLPQVVAR